MECFDLVIPAPRPAEVSVVVVSRRVVISVVVEAFCLGIRSLLHRSALLQHIIIRESVETMSSRQSAPCSENGGTKQAYSYSP